MLAKMDLFKEMKANQENTDAWLEEMRIGDSHPSEDKHHSGNRPGRSKGHEFGVKSRINIGCRSES
jgi:hypothetical protein